MQAPTDDLRRRLEEATGGDYQILSHLGRGGMGSVFLALDPSLHRHVAIKVMAPALIQDATMQERFRTEARIVATLRHPGIINIHGLRIVDDLYFFVMDYVEGDTLRAIIRAHGPLAIDVVKAVMYDVGSALQHAHSQAGGVIHRDVKPSNVILEPGGRAIVMDFGISKAANARSGLTMTGMVVGTPEYMSPEQCRGGEITAASDQYSLGLVGYAMLTGAPPFTGQHWSVLAQQTTAEPVPVRALRPDCPEEVAEAVERMLAKSVRDRFPDILSAAKALGGQPYEHGAAVRVEIGQLVEEIRLGPKAATPVVAVAIEGLPEQAETGETVSISVIPLDGVGRALEDREYTLESTNSGVLEVVGVDTVRAVHEGSASIVARCESAVVSRPLLVTPPPVAAVGITPPRRSIRPGDKVTLHASVMDRRGDVLEGRSIVWASSDPAVADVSRDGELVARSAGSTTIFATSEGLSTTLTLEVVPDLAKSASPPGEKPPVRPQPAAVEQAEARKTPAPRIEVPTVEVPAVQPEAPVRGPAPTPPARRPAPRPRGRQKKTRARALWLAGSAIAVIGAVVVVYPGLGPFSERGGPDSVPATLVITRGGAPVEAELELGIGESIDFDVELSDAEGQPVDATVEWISSDLSIASVDEAGQLVALASGSAILTAFVDGLEQAVSVAVADVPGPGPPPTPGERLAVLDGSTGLAAGGSLDLVAGQSMALGAQVLDDSGEEVSRPITWASSNPSVVSVDAAGTVRAVSGGSASLSATSGDLRQTIDVSVREVDPPVLVEVADVSIRRADNGGIVGEDLQLEVGATLLLLAQALEAGGGTVTGIPIGWSTSDASVASITSDGFLRAAGAGAARIAVRAGAVSRAFALDVLAPQPGTLVVTIRPWAYVTVNGERQGEDQRRLEMSLPPGSHTLRLENPAMSTFDTTIVIQSGQTTTVDRLMTPGGVR